MSVCASRRDRIVYRDVRRLPHHQLLAKRTNNTGTVVVVKVQQSTLHGAAVGFHPRWSRGGAPFGAKSRTGGSTLKQGCGGCRDRSESKNRTENKTKMVNMRIAMCERSMCHDPCHTVQHTTPKKLRTNFVQSRHVYWHCGTWRAHRMCRSMGCARRGGRRTRHAGGRRETQTEDRRRRETRRLGTRSRHASRGPPGWSSEHCRRLQRTGGRIVRTGKLRGRST